MKDKAIKKIEKGDSSMAEKNIVLVTNERFQKAYEKHEEFMQVAELCQNFVFGKQWKKEDVEENDQNRRPSLTINITLSTLNAMYSAYSDLEADIGTKSRNASSTDESLIMTKVIKQVMYDNGFSDEEADAFLEAATTGRAWFDLRIDTTENPLGEIKLVLDDYDTVVLSKDAAKYDPDTWPEIFYYDEYTKDEFTAEFGEEKAAEVEFDHVETGGHTKYKWLKTERNFGEGEDSHSMHEDEKFEKTVVVTREYYQYEDAYAFIDPNTQVAEIYYQDEFENEDEAKRIASESGLMVYATTKKRISITRVAGDVLIEDIYSPYRHYTKIPLFAYFSRGRTMGGVESIISPQEQLNKSESQELNLVNSSSNGGWQVEEDSLVNMTPDQLEKRGGKAGVVIVRRKGSAPLDKIYPNGVPTGISNIGGKSKGYIREIAGVNDGMLGITRTNDSAKLVDNKKQSGQALLQRLLSNLDRTRRIIGRNIVDLVQEYFPEPRLLRYTVEEGKSEEIRINQVDAAGRIANDLTLGRYDMVVTTRPRKDVINDYEADLLIRMQDAGTEVPAWMIVAKSELSDKKELVAHLRRQAGLDLTEAETEEQELQRQIRMADMQLELQKKQTEIRKTESEIQVNMATVSDTLEGQNYRFATELMAKRESDKEGNELRERLAVLSSDTSMAKEVMKNSQNNTNLAPQLGELKDTDKETNDVQT